MEKIIGRQEELKILDDCTKSEKPEFLVVYGRRRIGKTFLIKNYFNDKFSFYATGVFGGKNKEQLSAFYESLKEYGDNEKDCPKDWFEAFGRLKKLLNEVNDIDIASGKKVIFLDEVPWMNTVNSDFKAALDYFWNGWASTQNDILLIVCGSATSWILNNLLYDKGGFFHRITRKIHLGPMSLKECEELLISKDIIISKHQIVEYYMVFGGVPYYYSLIDKRLSLAQNVENLFFSNNGTLNNEFSFLFDSLFKKSNVHINIIKILSKNKNGYTRQELSKQLPDVSAGTLNRSLQELIECDFIRKYSNFTMKAKSATYQIIDPMLLFYLEFVEGGQQKEWLSFVGSNKYNSWCGNAFEIVCLLHINEIKQLLGISGIYTEEFSWKSKQKNNGAQVDLLIDRNDKTITICEMKYYADKFDLTSDYSNKLENKKQLLLKETKTNKTINIIMITSYGLTTNSNRHQIINDFTEEQLFI